MKKVIYYEEAKRLYVQEGFSLDTIVAMLKSNVARKTLFNWKTENKWDDARKKYTDSSKSIQEDLQDILALVVKEAKANPNAQNVFAVMKIITAMKQFSGVEFPNEQKDDGEKNISQKTFEFIQKEILGR